MAAAIPVALLGVPGWKCADGNPFPEVCNSSLSSWYGISCSSLGDVTAIDLEYLFLPGTLPSSIGSFTSLQHLSLKYNYLSGSIPSEIGLLIELTYFEISGNFIQGTIPSSIGMLSKLQVFGAYYNMLTGSISPTVHMMNKLEYFWILLNEMTGTIPSTIGNLVNLIDIQLEVNHFNGSIPSSFGLLSKLIGVELFSNSFSGTIPSSLGLLTNATQINLYDNFISGTIPTTLCLLHHSLLFLDIFNTTLTGTIPTCFGLLTNLQLLSLQRNSLEGTIPASLGFLNNLTLIDIGDNQLTGTIPWELGNVSKLQVLRVNKNKLYGTLPSSLQYEYELTALVVSSNSFTGTIPSYVLNLTRLVWLDMSENNFMGSIPVRIGDLISLQGLLLNSNQLTSTVPTSIQNLSHLKFLMLHKNRLTGSVPSLSMLSSLVWILLNNNLFSGALKDVSINSSYLEFYDMSNNQFTGSIPTLPFQSQALSVFAAAGNCLVRYLSDDICDARNLRVLALDGLHASPRCTAPFIHGLSSKSYVLHADTKSSIPACIYRMPHLEILHLSGNAFSGTFPSSVNFTATLVDLTLSHNILSGTIPSALQTKSWSRLDLSYNKISGTLENTVGEGNSSLSLVVNRLSGKTPSVLQSATNVNVLRGNLFECSFDTSVLPKHDPLARSYTCASDALEISFFVCLGVFGLAMLSALGMYLFKMETVHQLLAYVRNFVIVGSEVTHFDKIMSTIRYICISSACLIVVTLVPTYSVLGLFYGTHEYRYGWIVSAAYLSGAEVSIVLLLIWSGLMFYFLYSMTLLFQMISEQRSWMSTVDDVIDIAPRNNVLHIVLICILWTFDFVVIFFSNSLYITVATLFGYRDVVLIQILAGSFKVVWNILFVQNIHSITQYVLGIDRRELVVFDTLAILSIILINNIIVPILAEAINDPHCFYNVFFTPDAVSASYTTNDVCIYLFEYDVSSTCYYSSVELSTTYIPPFIYSYECSSALLVNYVTVFVYTFLALSLIGPLRIIIISFLRHPYGHGWRCFRDNNSEVLRMSIINYWTMLLSCCVMLMTFSVAYPPLAILICLSVVINTVAVQYLIRNNLAVFDGDIPDTGQSSMLLLLIIIGVFNAWFLFDIAGDKLGGTAAIWAPVSSIILPFGIWLCIMAAISSRKRSLSFFSVRSVSRIHIRD